MSHPLRGYRETTGGDPDLLAALARIARTGGSAALFQTLLTRDGRSIHQRGVNPRVRLRQLAGHTADPRIRREALERRRPTGPNREHRLREMAFRSGDVDLQMAAARRIAHPEKRSQPFDCPTTLCGCCGGRVPVGFTECACGAAVPPGAGQSATRSTTTRFRSPRYGRVEMR